jgi:hypothetical protein
MPVCPNFSNIESNELLALSFGFASAQVRELMEHLHLICNFTDVFGKFAGLERPSLVENLRVTFQFFEYAFLTNAGLADSNGNTHPFSRGWFPYLEHFNIRPSCTSGQPVSQYAPNPVTDSSATPIAQANMPEFPIRERLGQRETTRPDVWIWNAAMAVSLFLFIFSFFLDFFCFLFFLFLHGNGIQ